MEVIAEISGWCLMLHTFMILLATVITLSVLSKIMTIDTPYLAAYGSIRLYFLSTKFGMNKEHFFVDRFTCPSFTLCCTSYKINETISSVHFGFMYWLDTIFSLQCLPRILSSHNSFNHHHCQGWLWTHLSGEWDGRHQKWGLQGQFMERNAQHFEIFSTEMFWR